MAELGVHLKFMIVKKLNYWLEAFGIYANKIASIVLDF